MTQDKIEFLQEQVKPATAMGEVAASVAEVVNAPQAKLERYQEGYKIATSIEGVDVSYLTKFVLPYQDAQERFEKWTTSEDLGLI